MGYEAEKKGEISSRNRIMKTDRFMGSRRDTKGCGTNERRREPAHVLFLGPSLHLTGLSVFWKTNSKHPNSMRSGLSMRDRVEKRKLKIFLEEHQCRRRRASTTLAYHTIFFVKREEKCISSPAMTKNSLVRPTGSDIVFSFFQFFPSTVYGSVIFLFIMHTFNYYYSLIHHSHNRKF